jgi:hypothetical protein
MSSAGWMDTLETAREERKERPIAEWPRRSPAAGAMAARLQLLLQADLP